MSLEEVLEEVEREPQLARRITHWRCLSSQPGRYAAFPEGVDARLAKVLRERGIAQLYTHQADAVEAALAGKHVAVVTSTASGKTLCYNLPVVNSLLGGNGAARALYLFPTKALAQDQLAELGAIEKALGVRMEARTYDGDTPSSVRRQIRKSSKVIITNPDMLHMGILPHHTRWARFFQGLRWVVVDEIHTYRGVFGSHMANVLRRLKRIYKFYGAQPQFICCSATIANPLELAERLIEEDFGLIGPDRDGAPRGAKQFLFYNPPIVDRELGIRRSPVSDVRVIGERLLSAGVQTIVFAPARLKTEVLLTYLRDAARREGLSPEQVQGYRGGYLASERRDIERGLRERQVLGVVTTNALELGINIGHLDACVMTGYPGTIASTWQQAGRAGRRAALSAAILVAGSSPLDQYIINHPDYFFGRSPERALINPDNLVIAANHIRCAAFELPFGEDEAFGRFPVTQEVLQVLEQEGMVQRSRDQWHWSDEGYPAEAISLRTAEMDNLVIVDATQDGTVIGVIDRQSAPLLVHEGAIYLHGGRAYHVEKLDWEGRRAEVRPVEVGYYTHASMSVTVRVKSVLQDVEGAATHKAHGWVEIRSKPTSYKKVKLYTHETLGWGEISAESIPEQEMETTGYWFSILPGPAARLEQEGLLRLESSDRGPNWERQRAQARRRDNYLCRHCGAAERPGRSHDVHHMDPFRTFGYVRGRNENYIKANALENLVTLCRACHSLVEVDRMVRGSLSGLAHVLRHIAPLYLMTGSRDIGIASEVRSSFTQAPTVTFYDNAPGGLGFSESLYELHGTLLVAARDLISSCRCRKGCPSCIGPVDETGDDAKKNCLDLLQLLLEAEGLDKATPVLP